MESHQDERTVRMMKTGLKEQGIGTRTTFRGTFERLGTKNGYMGPEKTVLLKDIENIGGKIICDHLWFNLTKGFSRLGLRQGDVVEFDARVTKYEKGYKGRRWDVYKPIETDYKLSHPTKVKKVIGTRERT
jgi:hypothetical protein